MKAKTRADGVPLYSPGTVAAILLFFAFALQCMSTVAVMRRETNSWRWPLTAFLGLLVIAYVAAFIGNRVFTMIAG
jgi:ferrous iron transport protein B